MLRSTASFDRSRRYRYSLLRVWDESLPRCCFCMLNPSTADATQNDPTIARCIAYAERWGFGSLEAINIFALRSTDPVGLYRETDPVGPGNDRAIRRAAARADLVVLAWGNHGRLGERSLRVRRLLAPICTPHHFGLTKLDEPKHPLYLRADAKPRPVRHRDPSSLDRLIA